MIPLTRSLRRQVVVAESVGGPSGSGAGVSVVRMSGIGPTRFGSLGFRVLQV